MLTRRFNEYMPCKYTSLKDLQDRLDGTICRFEGRPVYVMVHSEKKLRLYDIPFQNQLIAEINPNDRRFDISMLRLGYANVCNSYTERKNHVLYFTRNPSKKYKQGTCASYIICKEIDGKRSDRYSGSMIMSQGFVDSVNDVYPSIEQIDEHGGSIALSMDIACMKDDLGILSFFYRGQKVAARVPDSDRLVMYKGDYPWVVEKLIGGLL